MCFLKKHTHLNSRVKMFAVFPFLLAALSVFSAGCGSDKLVDRGSAQTEEIIRSVQNNFADDGWTYTGYEVVEKDKENDTAVFLISYDAEGDARDLLEKNISEQPDEELNE